VLARLSESESMMSLLQNGHLQALLKEIDDGPDSEALVRAAMGLPVFVEFVDACLDVCASDGAQHVASEDADSEDGDG
jgi:hypothetical protein